MLGARRLSSVPDDYEPALPPDVVELLEALDAELDRGDRTVRALAHRLATLSAGSGPAAVSALKALGELVAAQRGPVAPEAAKVARRRRS
ncbi:MAG: hypothetical protein ACRDZ0_00690 [Acidimicrobiales bacterium]